jgi:hypothetical protein
MHHAPLEKRGTYSNKYQIGPTVIGTEKPAIPYDLLHNEVNLLPFDGLNRGKLPVHVWF